MSIEINRTIPLQTSNKPRYEMYIPFHQHYDKQIIMNGTADHEVNLSVRGPYLLDFPPFTYTLPGPISECEKLEQQLCVRILPPEAIEATIGADTYPENDYMCVPFTKHCQLPVVGKIMFIL